MAKSIKKSNKRTSEKKHIKPTMKYRSEIVIKYFRPYLKKNFKVLDVGCGNGWVADEIRKSIGCKIVGTDIIDYVESDIPFKKMTKQDKLPFKDNAFDAALFVDVLHHSECQEKLLREALRVAKKVLLFEVKPTLLAKFTDYAINQIHNPNMNIPFNFHSRAEWEKMFRRVGAKHVFVDVKKPLFFYPMKNFVFCLERR